MTASVQSAPAKIADQGGSPGRKVSLSFILDNPELPSPPALALQIVDAASRPDAALGDIMRLLKQDPGLCGKVLQTVNSSLFALPRPVASLDRAVMVLGLKPLRSLVLGLSLPAMNFRARDEVIYRYWQESVAGAVMTRELAVQLRRPEPDDDLVAGLLRDLGILVLRELFPEDYRVLWAQPRRRAADLCAAETAAFGVDHTEVTAALLSSWRLPPEIVGAIRCHHAPEQAERKHADRAWLLYFAAELAGLNGHASVVSDLLASARARFGMDQAALARFLEAVMPRIRDFAAVLKVDIGQCPNFAAIVSAGARELVTLTLENSRPNTAPQPPADANDQTIRARRPGGPPAVKAAAPFSLSASDSGSCAPTLPDFDIGCLDHLKPGGSRLENYEIHERIGQGAMGVVFKGFDPLLERFVAIKMLTPERIVAAEARERFLREARAAAAIQHEHVVTIHAVREVNHLPYIVMEYVNGESLQEVLDKSGPLPIPTVAAYARQIAAGLAAAHARKVVHRDVKPANILIARDSGSIKITDFGLARVCNAARNLSGEGLWIGTPLFMSPEQFGGDSVDHRADLFALASVLYTLCAGTTPFQSDSVLLLMRLVCNEKPARLRSLRPDAPPWLENLIETLHAKHPSARPASAQDVIRVIDEHAPSAWRPI